MATANMPIPKNHNAINRTTTVPVSKLFLLKRPMKKQRKNVGSVIQMPL